MSTYQDIIVETPAAGVGLVRLNRPQALNALRRNLLDELVEALEAFDRDPAIGAMVVTGSDRAFSAGADITEMAGASAVEIMESSMVDRWNKLRAIRKPIIAAVCGHCLGGGCELAMACDIIVASETASFGQPEINIGVIPGAGGTQRLTRALGKSLAMEVVLNDRRLTAEEALRYGLASRVVPVETYLDEAIDLASQIAARAPLAVQMGKAAINKSFETGLQEGMEYEKMLFYFLFASEDQKEGMAAFKEKRQPKWHRSGEAGKIGETDRHRLHDSGQRGDIVQNDNITTLTQYCRKNLELNDIELSSEYGYACLPLCVIDAVFSIGVRYASTQNTVTRFCDHFDIALYGGDDTPEPELQLSVSDFVGLYDEYGVEGMTDRVYQNRQRTSSRNGILKAEAVLRFSQVLSRFGVEYLQDAGKILGNQDFEAEIQMIPGQRSGISLKYFYMLAGSEDFIKPDRMINRFVHDAIGKSFGIEETTTLLVEACRILSEEFPGLTPRTLDNVIWQYQRAQ